ncbi:MAG: 3-dehydroquinate synthase [Clostridiaceae bacterium]|nr:3-dehydroquinate synthase [Clostridiaceae bacterium]
MKETGCLTVNLGERSYNIHIEPDFDRIVFCLEKAGIGPGQSIVVITDENVDRFYGDSFMKILEDAGYKVYKYVLAPGEESKNLKTVEDIYKYLISLRLDRKSTLIALGGGVVGDITGFAASTYLRGVNFVQVPTTLLAQIDSSVGGKTGVDFEGIKNIIGTFYQPRLVYINVNALKTIPIRELRSGMAEVIKHGLILDEEFYTFIREKLDDIFEYKEDVMKYVIWKNCSIKGSVVKKDEKEESGFRVILNFGHTIGHAIESVSGFGLLHGECVSIGMAGVFKMACRMGMVSGEMADDVISLLRRAGLPTELKGISPGAVYEKMLYDKKAKGNRLLFILPCKIGMVERHFVDDEKLVMSILTEILS